MEPARRRVLDDFPYPVAYTYSLVFDQGQPASLRRWALYFTEYQLLRVVALPLVGQYLREPIDESNPETIRQLNTAIASIRAPFFSDWIDLVYALRKHLPKVGIKPVFPGLGQALDTLGAKVEERPVDQKGVSRHDPLRAIMVLRNATGGHGAYPDEAEAARHLEQYLSVLHDVLDAFDFLGDFVLKVRCDAPTPPAPGCAWVRTLQGAVLADPVEEKLSGELERAFRDECETVLVGPGGRIAPLYPLAKPMPDQADPAVLAEAERLFLYDGHYGKIVQPKPPIERSFINYLGIHHRAADSASCERLKTLLDARRISFLLDKADTAPWTIADNAADFSRRTLADLLGSKYFPECYVPFEELEQHFAQFLGRPLERSHWPKDTTVKRYIHGFVLAGLAGAGKTAFLARQVERMVNPHLRSQFREGEPPCEPTSDSARTEPRPPEARHADSDRTSAAADGPPGVAGTPLRHQQTLAPHENPNLVLFLRGQAVLVRPSGTGVSLFHDIAEKLGVALEGSTVKQRKEGGFSSMSELLAHLHAKWRDDKLEGRRMVLVLDALNEAPYTENVVKEAIGLIELAACYPWLKVVVSLRQEWLGVFAGKLGFQEADPIEAVRPFLYTVEPEEEGSRLGRRPPPVVDMKVFDAGQAKLVYQRYQGRRRVTDLEPGDYRIPACLTPWEAVELTTRDEILVTPLYLHLFMEAFDGRAAEPVATKPELFRHYINEVVRDRPGLDRAIETVVGHLLSDLSRGSAALSDDDVHALNRAWEEAHSAGQIRLGLSPVEALAHEGVIRKRDTEEGGAYGFVFQEVADYVIYRQLAVHKPKGEDDLAYWTRRAAHERVFPEYAGAFGFLLRDWAAGERLDLAGRLAENSADWITESLTTFLVEQARVSHGPGQPSPRASIAAGALSRTGRRRVCVALYRASAQIWDSENSLEALVYLRAMQVFFDKLHDANADDRASSFVLSSILNSIGVLLSRQGLLDLAEVALRRAVEISEALWRVSPGHQHYGDTLSLALGNLGNVLDKTGRVGLAEDALRRGIEISESLWQANPFDVSVGTGLCRCLGILGLLLSSNGRSKPAEAVYRRTVEISEVLWQAHPALSPVAECFASSLIELGALLRNYAQTGPAKAALDRAASILEELWLANPDDVYLGANLGRALINLGLLLQDIARVDAAEAASRRAVTVLEKLWQANHGQTLIGYRLSAALGNLGSLLSASGRPSDAEDAYRRSIEISEALWQANPTDIDIETELGGALNNLGTLLSAGGRAADAEDAYRRSIEIFEVLRQANRKHVDIGGGLSDALHNLGNLLRDVGRAEAAEMTYRRAVEISEALWKDNSGNVRIGDGLGSTLNNLGLLLRDDGRVEPAEKAYRRSVEIYEALWTDNPRNVQIGHGLGLALNHLGNLLSADGRIEPAAKAYGRSVEIYEVLWKDNPQHVEITAGFAGSLCDVGRWHEAEQRVNEVLAKVPRHPYANQLKRYIVASRPRGEMPSVAPASQASTSVGRIGDPSHTGETRSVAPASQTSAQQTGKPWWKRWLKGQ
jgi:tetratricopeptide (TPR) repeat protein